MEFQEGGDLARIHELLVSYQLLQNALQLSTSFLQAILFIDLQQRLVRQFWQISVALLPHLVKQIVKRVEVLLNFVGINNPVISTAHDRRPLFNLRHLLL